MWYDKIRQYYRDGIYTVEHLNIFVTSGMITQQQADDIILGKE